MKSKLFVVSTLAFLIASFAIAMEGNFEKAMEYLKAGGESDSFNLGNGSGYSVREIIETVRSISGRDFKVIEAERRQGDPPVLVGSSGKAAKVLGWKPRYADIETIVETAYRWHSKNT